MDDRNGQASVALWAAALAGALAAGVAIATSELLAGLWRGFPSLVVAVGGAAIALQPPGAKDVMVALFGTNDKLALNVLVVVVTVAIGAVTGILAARRRVVGTAVFVGFGVVAAVVAAAQPLVVSELAVLVAAVSAAAGLGALRVLLGLAPAPTPAGASRTVAGPDLVAPEPPPAATAASLATSAPASAATPSPARDREGSEWSRRRFLVASAGTLGGVIVAGGVGRALLDAQHPGGIVVASKLPAAISPVPPLTTDQALAVPGVTPLVIPNDQFYRIDTALLVPDVDVSTWRLEVKGMVDRPATLTYDELLAMPLYEQYVTIACVSNKVGDHLVGNALWTGVRLKDVLAAAGVQAGATQIVGRSVDDFTVGFPTSWAMAPEREPMIAVGMNRELLPAEHGFPARLIVPGLYGYVSATKWLASIELTTREAVDGYWVPLGWAKDAPILTQSRIDVPDNAQHPAPGPVEVAGVAWAPDRGITGVEVRIDGGAWQPARISRPISKATWVQWAYTWTATAGRHSIEARAIDGTGAVQTDQVTDPAPDGARGHHKIFVDVG